MTDLKPCPFCGSSELRTGGDDKIVGVWCAGCQAVGPNHYGRYEWNTRAEPDPAALVKAALELAAEKLDAWGDIYGENAARSVLAIARDPAAVAQIIKKAREDRG